MKRKFTLLIAALALLTMMATTGKMWGQAAVNTTLWEETWTGGDANETPSAYGFEGTTVYGNATLTYAQSSTNTILYAQALAGGTSPELLLSKSNQTWTISNIPTGQATEMSLTFLSNKATFDVTSTTTGITISGSEKSWTISANNVTSFNLTIKNTGSSNARIDNILLKVTTAGGGSDPTITLSDSGTGNIGNYAVNTEITRDFTVTQSNLTASISLSATNGGTFTINNETITSIPAGDGSTVVKWHFTPTATGQFTSAITATSGETSATCTYSGYAYEVHNVNIANMEHGTVTANPTSTFYWELVTLTITPDEGYELDELMVVDADNNPVTLTNNSFHMPDSDATVSATFVEASPTTIVTDELTYSLIGVTGTSYSKWSGKTSNSDAVYAGQSAGGNSSIQLRATSPAGIISTTSGGKVKKVTVTWNSNTSGRTLDIYGSNTAYTASSELYSSTTQGTKLGSISSDNNAPLNITGDYAYIGLRSNSGAMYIDKIEIDWAVSATTVANPTITPNGGAIDFTQSITLACSTDEANIYYTTDGNDPIVGTTTQLYSEPFTISEACTVKAIAAKEGMDPSEIVSASFTQAQVATPTFSLDGGTYFGEQEVTISCTTAGATIFYSIDGGEPNLTYENAITISSSCTLKAKATKTGCLPSELAQAQYTIEAGYETIFSQDWEGEMNEWTFVNVEGDEVWTISSSSGTSNYAKMSGYNGSATNEDWIISPSFNLNDYNNTTLSFKTAKNYNGNALEVYFSNDYNGQPSSATWTQLECTLSSGSWNWTESGNINLSELNLSGAACRIGFKYTSTSTYAATWEVDDILLVGQVNINPMITADPMALEFTYVAGGNAAAQVLTITGSNLTAGITATITTDSEHFAISEDEENWGTTLPLSAAGDMIAVRLNPGITATGTYNGVITLTSEGASNVTISLTGEVTSQIYNIVITQPASGGTIEADKESAQAGEIVTLTAHPAAGYDFTSWEVLDDNFESVIVNDNQFEMPASDVLVSATFTPKETYLITTVANPTEGGTIITDATEDKAYEGQTVTLTCEASTGYSLTSIVITKTEDGSATGITPTASGDDYTFVMPGYAVTATATFEEFVDYVTLPFEWEGGTTAELSDNTGVTVSSGGDYGDTHAPYQVKFNNEGNYIQIKTDSQIETVSVGVKKIGGAPVSKIIIKESADGTNFEEVETFELEGAQNAILNLETSNEFDASTRFIQIYFNKTGQNVGVGPITITKFSTEPVINAENVNLAYDATSGEIGYTITRPVTGITLEASTTADWISDIQVTEEKVTFNTTPNEGEEDRVATFTLSYTGAENKEVTVTQAHFVVDFATLPFEFTGGYNDIDDVVGFTYDGLGGYTSSVTTKLKFDDEGDWLILKLNEAPTSLSYDIKGNGTSSDGTFSVQTSVNGVDYEDLVVYTTSTLNNIIKTFTYVDFDPEVRYIKWIYTYRANGNIGLGNIRASENYDIYGNCTVENLTVNPTEILTVYAGSVMTVGTLTNNGGADNLIIEDGGQLIHNNTVAATVKKTIAGSAWSRASEVDGWYTIASPVADAELTQATTGNYDFYKYDEESAYWLNQKVAAHNIDKFEQGVGYLYAHENGYELSFGGDMIGTSTEIAKDLSFERVSEDLRGFNLMGNPFTRNLTAEDMTLGNEPLTAYYVVEGGNELTVSNNPIKPGQGFMVQAEAEGQQLVFNPSAKGFNKIGYISIVSGNSESTDRAFVQIGGGNTLRKMSLNENSSKVYVMKDNKDFAAARINALQGSIPVCFKANKLGTYTITVEAIDVKAEYLHLIDNFTHEDIDLLLEPSYTFNAGAIDNEQRFTLVFKANANIDEIEVNDNFAYQNGSDIIVNGNGELQVFDVTGRMVMNTKINGIQTVNVPATGMYIFRMVGESVQTQKIVVR